MSNEPVLIAFLGLAATLISGFGVNILNHKQQIRRDQTESGRQANEKRSTRIDLQRAKIEEARERILRNLYSIQDWLSLNNFCSVQTIERYDVEYQRIQQISVEMRSLVRLYFPDHSQPAENVASSVSTFRTFLPAAMKHPTELNALTKQFYEAATSGGREAKLLCETISSAESPNIFTEWL